MADYLTPTKAEVKLIRQIRHRAAKLISEGKSTIKLDLHEFNLLILYEELHLGRTGQNRPVVGLYLGLIIEHERSTVN